MSKHTTTAKRVARISKILGRKAPETSKTKELVAQRVARMKFLLGYWN